MPELASLVESVSEVKHEVNDEDKTRGQKAMVIVCAYNEAENLKRLLPRLDATQTVIVDDGSTDQTSDVAAAFGIKVIRHPQRLGKSAALRDGVAYAANEHFEVAVDLGADGLPRKGSIQRLLCALEDPTVGGASALQIPLQTGSRVAYLIDDVIWSTLAKGKEFQMRVSGDSYLGAVMFAFRVGPFELSKGTNDDEVVGSYLRSKSLRVVFERNAVVYFDASTNLHHILDRRVRMNFGHMVQHESTAPTSIAAVAAVGLIESLMESRSRIPWAPPAMAIELLAKLWAWYDFRHRRFAKYSKWVTREKGIPSEDGLDDGE